MTWICHPNDNRKTRLVPVFQRRFAVRAGLTSATLRLTAHGVYEAVLNDKLVTEHKFCPGLTSYYHRIQVQEYDVTTLLHEGENLWQTTIGDGWWRWNDNFGGRLALWGELTLGYIDDSAETIQTDEHFIVGTGPILRNDLQKGEVYDARIEPHDFIPAAVETFHTDAAMIPTEGVPTCEHEAFPGTLIQDSVGNTVIDFGQNLAGYIRMKLYHTAPGQLVHLKMGEGLDLEGRFSTSNCDGGMSPFQEITYICKGAEVEEYKSHFTYAGFRYTLLEGVEDGEFEAIAVYSDMEESGDFACSEPLLNQLFRNVVWSQKGNFLDVPVDCPTRERNAWTGDAMIYCKTAAYLMDVRAFFKKWLKDQSIEQYASGKVGITFPSTSSMHDPVAVQEVQKHDPRAAIAGPEGNGNIGEDSVGWGDSAVWIPYQMYLMYGDRDFLEEHYETAKRWVEYSLRCMQEPNPLYADKPWYTNGDGIWIYDTKFHYGEWNEPLPPRPEVVQFFLSGKSPAEYVQYIAQFGKPEVATAYTKRSCDNLSHIAAILGKIEDARYYAALAERIKTAYDAYMIASDGAIQPGHQAAYIRALALDLVSEEKKPLVIIQLKKELEAANYHLNTGFLSTVYLLPTLCDNGMVKEAFRILQQTDSPSWLHPITLGATTMLERWDGMDTFRDSFNHYSFGAVCQFLFEYVGGIRPTFDAPGFKEFELKPILGGSLNWAKAEYKTQYGLIRSAWERDGQHFAYICTVPENTTAQLTLPDGRIQTLKAGEYRFEGELHGYSAL